MTFLIVTIKLLILISFLVIIHEGAHFLVAKLSNVKVNEFAIGFGPIILKKKGKETNYEIRLIPLGGFVRMEGEDETSNDERSFNKASIFKRIAIVLAGPVINIAFGLIVYNIMFGMQETLTFIKVLGEALKQLVTGQIGVNQMMGPVGIGGVISQTSGLHDFLVMLSLISVSLGITNLLPIPALDGGKLLILLIEAIRRKPLKQETEACIQILGFSLLMTLSVIVMYQDITRLLN